MESVRKVLFNLFFFVFVRVVVVVEDNFRKWYCFGGKGGGVSPLLSILKVVFLKLLN